MEKRGIVISTSEETAVVRFSGQCGGDCKGCPAASIFTSGKSECVDVNAGNSLKAGKGDSVRIELGTGKSLAAYGIAYGIPMIGLVFGALAGKVFSSYLPFDEGVSVAFSSLLCTFLSFVIALKIGKNFHAVPEIVEILKHHNSDSF
jgi:positive regulator of sigma E activity